MNRTALVGIGLTAMWLQACADNNTSPQGGGSIEPGQNFAGLYVAAGSDSISRIELDGRTVKEMRVGGEPTRIARAGNRVYITLRADRSVAVLEDDGKELVQVGKFQTGAEPYGIVATADRIYVASSVGGFVGEYDAKSFEQLRAWNISGEPRWLTMHTSKRTLYVGSAYGGTMTQINLVSGVARPVALPIVNSFNFNDGSPLELSRRITSDIVVAPNGADLYVGMLYVDNKTTIPDVKEGDEDPCNPTPTEPDPNGMGGGETKPGDAAPAPPPPGGMGRGPDGGGLGCGGGYNGQKFNPVVDKLPVDPVTGEVDANRPAEAISILSGATIEDSSGFPINFEAIAGYPVTLAISEDSELVFAAIDGAEALVVLKIDNQNFNQPGVPTMGGAARVPNADIAFPGGGVGFSFRNSLSVKTGAAPRGIALINGKVFVHAFFDQKLEDIALDDVRDFFDFQSGNATKGIEIDVGPQGQPRQLRTSNALRISTEAIGLELDQGRRLFYATNNPMMATVGAAVSCATCHFELRTDGLTWQFERGLRQTPNLSVNLRESLPVGWAGNVLTVADEGFNTSQKLMGGQQLTHEHSRSIEAFLYSARAIDTPNKATANEPKVVRGMAVFANAGCHTCHNGVSYTDNKTYTMLGLDVVKTRPLSGIAASAPYFHDGSASTLREVVRRAANGEMGNRFSISQEDEDALVEYLKSL